MKHTKIIMIFFVIMITGCDDNTKEHDFDNFLIDLEINSFYRITIEYIDYNLKLEKFKTENRTGEFLETLDTVTSNNHKNEFFSQLLHLDQDSTIFYYSYFGAPVEEEIYWIFKFINKKDGYKISYDAYEAIHSINSDFISNQNDSLEILTKHVNLSYVTKDSTYFEISNDQIEQLILDYDYSSFAEFGFQSETSDKLIDIKPNTKSKITITIKKHE